MSLTGARQVSSPPLPARGPSPPPAPVGTTRRPRCPVAGGKAFSYQQLRQLGVSQRRIASSEFTRVLPGCFTPTDDPAPLTAVAAFALRHVVPGAAISSVSAAEILGLPLPFRLTWDHGSPLHVDLAQGHRRSNSHRLVTFSRSGRRPLTLPSGVRVADPLEVLRDLAGQLCHDDLVACIDGLGSLRRTDLRVTVESVRNAAEAMSGRHVRALRRAAREARDAVDSPRETATRLLLMRRGFPEPDLNRPVVDEATGTTYYLDLSYERWRIAIEYDGKDHFDPDRARRDRHKDEVLHEQGWSVLRITVHDHRNPAHFLARLRARIAAAS